MKVLSCGTEHVLVHLQAISRSYKINSFLIGVRAIVLAGSTARSTGVITTNIFILTSITIIVLRVTFVVLSTTVTILRITGIIPSTL